jgi:hypothetical protein
VFTARNEMPFKCLISKGIDPACTKLWITLLIARAACIAELGKSTPWVEFREIPQDENSLKINDLRALWVL